MIWFIVFVGLAITYYPIAYAFGWSGADDGTIAAGCLFIVVGVVATVFAEWVNERD